jgi:long-chain acyl-CoA synthetase
VATGDMGRLDDDGFLFLTGRKKDVIITQSGVKVPPVPIEQRILAHRDVRTAVVVAGTASPGVWAVVALRDHSTAATVASIQRHIDEVSRSLDPSMCVTRVVFTRTEFTRESGLLTSTLKLNRAAVARRFGPALDRGDTWTS